MRRQPAHAAAGTGARPPCIDAPAAGPGRYASESRSRSASTPPLRARAREALARLRSVLTVARRPVAEGRVGWPGACADRARGEADWTVRLVLLDARIGRTRLGEPLELYWRCRPDGLQALLAALSPDARLAARIEFDRGARMRARLRGIVRLQPPPGAADQKNARTPNETPRPGSGA